MLRMLFNGGWYFKKGEQIPTELIKEEYERVDVPHTYNALDGQDGGDNYYRGYAIYVKQFYYEDDEDYPISFIEFRGVGQSAEVYLNGNYVGRHDGGYSTFRFDITEYLDKDNLLVVRCDNSKNEKVYPQMADFTFYGGIYRDVYLLHCKNEYFDLLDHGCNGISVSSEIKNNKAEVTIEGWVSSGDDVELHIEEIKEIVKIEDKHFKITIDIENPHLWDGLNDPYLYTLKARLLKDGEVKDEQNVKFGIREFHVDPNKGFFLNGRSYPLRGVSKHQDRLGIGNAVSRNDLAQDMQIIKELGATTIRLAHYQHDQYFYDLCDENGLVVWAEIPYISRHMPEGKENTLSQMEELIKQNYNHPCIVCWGLSNEITIGGGAESDSLINNHRELNDLCHKLDKTRLTTMAHVMSQDPKGTVTRLPDIASYNHYYGWYVGDTSGYAKFFDKFHEENPDYCIGLSEYGADANPMLHNNNPVRGDYSEEYQCKYHEEVLAFINQRDYLWASHVWNMFDFAADARREGGNPGRNQKGLVTMDRKLKKDSFYLYKSYWNKKDKFVHLCGKRYVNRHEDETRIKVYSNLDKVTLYVDNQLFEEKQGNNIFEFIVPINGEHHIEAVSGEYKDSMDIVHVLKEDESYILKDTGALNWFDDNDEDCYSISDTINDLNKNPEAAKILEALMAKMVAQAGELAETGMNNQDMSEIIGNMQLSSILAFGGEGISAQEISELNQALQKIRK